MLAIPILAKSIHQTMSWIYDIEEKCHWQEDNQKQTFAALRIVLHNLRDLLPLENAIHLSAQLPLIIRGLFFESWSPSSNRPKIRKKEDFIIAVEEDLLRYQDFEDTELIVRSVLETLSERISIGEIEKVLSVIPPDIRELF